MTKFQLKKRLTQREAFGELLKQTRSFSAFTYDPETGCAITEPELPPPSLKERFLRFTSRSEITYDEITR